MTDHPTKEARPPEQLRSVEYCARHRERHLIAHGDIEHHEGAPCAACDYLDAAQETRALFELQYRRMAEATALWRAESPKERELIQPDLGSLLSWLMERAALPAQEPLDVERLAQSLGPHPQDPILRQERAARIAAEYDRRAAPKERPDD